jgi:non-reducing end alpha-L-arabinofuranosidase
MGPCDLYAAANIPCVAAFSTVRVLLSTYKGPLYQVRKGGTNNVFKGNQPIGTVGGTTGGTTQEIGFTADGFADSAAQDAFCGTATCTFSRLYDQSGKGNDLTQSPAGQYEPGPDYEIPATHSVMIGTHKVYSAYFPNPPSLPSGSAPSGYGYRNNKTSGMPTGSSAPQGVYMVADGTHSGNGCCFDFGNAETNNGSGPTGAMAALNLGTSYWGTGAGSSPWFEGDFEAGVWAGGSSCGTPGSGQLTCSGRQANPQNPSMKAIPYAFGILKTGTTNGSPTWVLKVGNATTGTLTTAYNGAAPAKWALQGAVLLGTGGDNSNSSWGTFFEGAITAGQPTDATDDAVHANIAAVGYGK